MTTPSVWPAPTAGPVHPSNGEDPPGDRHQLGHRHLDHHRAGRPIRRRVVVAAAVATVVALTAVAPPMVNARRGSGGSGPAPTPTPSPTTFTRVFSTQDNGAIRMFGNSNMTCDPATTNCTTARDATPGLSLWNYNNNAYTMRWIDNDADATTFNSTSADLEIPDGSTILRAQLVWGGNDGSARVGDRGTVRLAVGNGDYQAVSAAPYTGQQASPIWTSSGFYQASADVTSIVAANPTGTYWVADVASIPDVSNKFAGWALIVAYRNPGEPVRDLTINLGLDQISGTDNTQIMVDGFLTPLTGTVNASVGLVAWEGDLGIVGDTAALDGTQLSNANHPSENFFDSSVSDPTVTAARNPDYVNGMGVDVARVDASNIIANGATSATLLLSTTGDAYAPGVVTTQVDLFAPAFAAVTKSVVNLNGHDPAWPGDTLEYQISLANTGGDSAERMVLTDTVPAGTTYVANSIVYLPSTATPTEATMTDANGDDAADYDAATGLITARVGSGASATGGGTLAPLQSAAVRFRVTVDDGPTAGTPVDNSASLEYLSPTIAKTFTYRTNTVTTPTATVADVKVVKTVLGNPTADNPVRYQVVVTNNGPSIATGVVLNDTMPTPTFSPIGSPISGMSVVDDPPLVVGTSGTCVRNPFTNGSSTYYPSFDCTIDALAVGESATVTFDATVYGTAIADITNTASVTADQVDPVAANNSDTRTSPRSEVTDLWLRGGPNPGQWNGLVTAGKPFPYLMEVVTLDYQGYATASDVVVSMELPLGFRYVAGSSTGPTCTQTGQLLECPFGANAPGPAPGPNWTVLLLPDPSLTPGNYPYSVQATTATPEVSLANNTNSGNFSLDAAGGYLSYQNDLAVVETLDGTITAGGVASYTITLTNNGPSTVYAPGLTQPTPTGYTIDSFSADHGDCSTLGGDLTCAFDPLVPADQVVIHVVYRVDPDLGADDGSTTIDVTATVTEGEDYAQLDTGPTNNSATASGQIERSADLALAKAQNTYGFTWGDPISFTFTATNAGPSTARTIVLNDTLPVNMTAITPMPAGCSVVTPATATAGDVFECVIADIAVGGTAAVTVPVATSSGGAGSATNTASVASSTADPDATNNTPATTVSTADQSADLSITKSIADATPTPGVPFDYIVTVTNHGPSDAHADWSVTDTLPAGVNFVSGANCAPAGPPGAVTCATGTPLIAGTTATFDLTVDADPDATGRIVNVATVDPGITDANYDDNSPNNNTASIGADLSPLADLVLTAPAGPAAFPAGTSVPVVYTVSNLGPSTAASPVATFTVPAGVTVTADATYPAGYGCTQSGQQVRCTLPAASPGIDQAVPLVVTVDAARSAGTVAVDGRVGTETAESDLTNNAASTVTLTVTNDAALTITKAGPIAFTAGSIESYAVTVANSGNSDTPSGQYVVTDTVPAGLTVLSAAMPGATCSVAAQQVSCTRSRIPGDTEVTLTIGVLVGTDIDPAGVTNTARLTNNAGVGTSPLDSNSVTTPVTASSALWVSKSADRATVAAGGSIVYSMVIGNDGPSTAPAVVVTDDLPGGLTVLGGGVTTDTGTCAGADGATSVTCDLGDLAVGDRANISILARVPNSIAVGTALTNTVTVTDGRDDAPATDSITTATVHEADLTIVKYPLSDIPIAGLEHQYVISVANNGPSTAIASVITDQLPNGATFLSAGPAEANCSETTGVVTCAVGDLARGQLVSVLVTVALNPSLGGTDLTNSASVSSTTAELNAADNFSTVTQAVEALSTYAMTKEITAGLVDGAVVSGDEVTYTITATNVGPSDASNAWIIDRIPSDANGNELATFVSAAIDGDVATCEYVEVVDDGPTPVVSDRYHQCTHGSLPVGATMTMTYTIRLNATATGELTNWAWGGADNNTEASPTPADGIENAPYATVTAPIVGQADVDVAVAVPPATPGAPLDAVVTVTNLGPNTADETTVDIVLPSGASFSAASGASCGEVAGNIRCTLGSLSLDAQTTVVLTLVTDPSATGSAEVAATAATASIDPDLTNNQATAAIVWTPASGLTIDKYAPSTAVPGTELTYEVVVGNGGPSTATSVVVTDVVPDGAVPTAATIGGGGTCSIAAQQVTCTRETLSVDETATVTITATIDPTATNDLVNVAEVTAATATDPTSSAAARTTLQPTSSLAILKSAPATAVPGGTLTYEVDVINDGPSAATGVVIEDPLPAGAVATTASVTGGGTCTIGAQLVRCTLATLGVATTATVTIVADIDPTATGELANQAQASSATTSTPVLSEIARTTLVPDSNLAISKAAPTVARPGSPMRYVISVTNAGPSTATALVVQDQLPPGVVPTGVVMSGGGDCTVARQDVRCGLPALDVGATATVSIETTIDPAATGELTNTATAVSDWSTVVQSDPVLTALDPASTLTIVKVAPAIATPGQTMTYEMSATNSGPSTATGIVISDELPFGVTAASASMTSGGTCSITQAVVTCDLAALAPNATATVTIAAMIDADMPGELVNTATVTAATSPDQASSNQTRTVLVPSAELSIVKTAPAQAVPGSTIRYSIDLTNVGPSTATGVVVTDEVPVGAAPMMAVFTNGEPSPVTCAIDGQLVTCEIGRLAADTTVTVTIDAAIHPDTTGELSNTATAAAATTEPIASGVTQTTLTPVIGLTVNKTAPTTATPGTKISYELTVTNGGPSTAFGVVINDSLPDQVLPIKTTMSAEGDCTVTGQDVDCELASLAVGASAAVTIEAMISADASGEINNTAEVTSKNGEPATSNVVTTRLVPAAELTLDVSASDTTMTAGEPITYSIKVANMGPSMAENVIAVDRLPHGLSTDDGSVSATKGRCAVAGQVVSCDLGHLMPDENHTITIVAQVAPDMAHGTMMNNAVSLSSSSTATTVVDDVDVEVMTPGTTTTQPTTTVPTTDTVSPTSTTLALTIVTIPGDSGSGDPGAGGGELPIDQLPRSGSNLGGLLVVAVALVGAGALLRRLRRRSAPH